MSTRAFDMIAEWGRERLDSTDLPALEADAATTPGTAGTTTLVHGHAHDAVDCAFCKARLRAYKTGM